MLQPIDQDSAIDIVKSLYPSASEPLLSIELEASRGTISYRPYYVYARFLLLEYRKLTKADNVAFAYDESTIRNALITQKSFDDALNDTIPEAFTVEALLEQLKELECNFCDGGIQSLGIGIY